jgi:hypothetical protein
MADHVRANAASRERMRNLLVTLDPSASRPDDGGWSAAETLAHLAFWDRMVLERWQRADRLGQDIPDPLPEGLSDIVNEAVIGHWSAISLQAAAELAERAAGEVDALIERLPDDRVAIARERGFARLVERALHRDEHLDSLEQIR